MPFKKTGTNVFFSAKLSMSPKVAPLICC